MPLEFLPLLIVGGTTVLWVGYCTYVLLINTEFKK